VGEIISVVEAETCVPDWLRTLALRTVAIQVTPPPLLPPPRIFFRQNSRHCLVSVFIKELNEKLSEPGVCPPLPFFDSQTNRNTAV